MGKAKPRRLTKAQRKTLADVQKSCDKKIKKQVQEGLGKVFNQFGYRGVANEIKHGRNVRGNVEFGLRFIHDKIGPRVNVDTYKVTPMSKTAKRRERKMFNLFNKLLKQGGYKPISPALLQKFRKGDMAFKRKMAKRRKQKRSKR